MFGCMSSVNCWKNTPPKHAASAPSKRAASTSSKHAASTLSKPKTTATTPGLDTLAAGESHSLYTAAAKPTRSSSFHQLSFSPAFKSTGGVKGGEGLSNVTLYPLLTNTGATVCHHNLYSNNSVVFYIFPPISPSLPNHIFLLAMR